MDGMYNKRAIIYILLVSLAAFNPIIILAMGQQMDSSSSQGHSNISQGFIFGLNDSLVNSSISKYPFFVLDGYASWCEPCIEMNTTLHKLSAELNGQVIIGTIDVEKNTKIAQRFNITHYPTLLMFKNGTLIGTEVGFGTESEIVEHLKILNPGLNISRVASAAQPQTTTVTPVLKQGDVPLISLGTDKPALPMRVDDSTLAFALNKYPFFILMGFADWCGYCKEMNATILELSNELKGQVAFGLINAEKNNNISDKYDITSYPRILIFKNGSLVQTQRGYTEKSKFVGILKGVEPKLDTSHVNITAIPVPSTTPSKPTAAPSSTSVIKESASEEDAALKYLEKILNYTQMNRTSGATINIFIINACPQAQGR